MKKIFTLFAAAALTANAMAQDVEILKVDEINDMIQEKVASPIILPASESMFVIFPETSEIGGKTFTYGTEGSAVSYDAAIAKGVPSVVFEASTKSMDFKGVSSPQPDAYIRGEFNNAFRPESQDFWDMTAEDGFEHPYRMYVKPNGGNPSRAAKFWWNKSEDGFAENFKADELYYELGCGQAPQKGVYYSLKPKAAGTVELAVFSNRPFDNGHVVLNVTDMKELTKDQIKVKGILGNRNKGAGIIEIPLTDEMKFDKEYVAEKYPSDTYPTLAQLNKVNFIGYMTFAVEAGKEYYVFSPKQQLGFYGYAFTVGGTSVNNATEVKAEAPAKVLGKNGVMVGNYNAAGQLVK